MKMKSKKIKKLTCILLIFTMVFSLITPLPVSAATHSATTIKVGESIKLKLSGFSCKTTWNSSNEEIATVSSNGTVTGVSVGTTTVVAKLKPLFNWFGSNKTEEFPIKVIEGIDEEALQVNVGEKIKLDTSVKGTTTWESSDNNIATVKEGTVTGISAGIVTITATIKTKGKKFWFFTWGGKTVTEIFQVTVVEKDGSSTPEPDDNPSSDDSETVTYTVTFDTNGGSIIDSQTVKQGETVEFPNIPEKEGFGFAGWYSDKECKHEFDFSEVITESLILYACWVNTSDKTDSDNDGLTDAEEEFYGTDLQNQDSDGDSLEDYVEINILGTDPLKKDSDENGVEDGDEDFDEDDLSNKYELNEGLNPILKDSDYEGLDDNLELEIGTDPLKADTDGDGESDYDEYKRGTDPTVYDDPEEVIEATFDNENFAIIGADVEPVLEIEASRKVLDSLTVTPVSSHYINNTNPGYIGEAYDFTMDGTFESAKLSMTFDEALLEDDTFCPTIYYYNENTGELEELPTEVKGNVAIANLEHFSTYILLNKTAFDEIWSTEIKSPEDKDENSKKGLDVVLAIDSSGSMSSNDGNSLRKEAAISFVERLGENDRAAVVDFDDSAKEVCSLTQDKDVLSSAINSINSSGGTNLSNAVSSGINILTRDESSVNKHKFIILLTDGDGSYSHSYSELAVENDIQIYTIGLGDGVNDTLLQKIADDTDGKYYFASSAEDLLGIYELTADETIDYITDSNNDGISDYYTQLLVDGKLRFSTGSRVFGVASYEDIQANDDYDGDGLLNGEEIEVMRSQDGTKVYVSMKSSPVFINSDYDEYSDYEEIKTYNTDPMTDNVIIDQDHLNDIKDSSLYISNKYKEFYDSDVLGSAERGLIWLSTHVIGTDYDHTMLYKAQFSDYFNQMTSTEALETKKQGGALEMAQKHSNQVVNVIGEVADKYKTYQDIPENIEEELANLQKQALKLDREYFATNSSNFDTTDECFQYMDDLMEQFDNVSQNIEIAKSEVKISVRLDKFKNATQIAGVILLGVDILSTSKEIYDEYIQFMDQIDIMKENIYIYEALINSSDIDEDLKSAAVDIRNVLNNDLENSTTEVWEKLGYEKQLTSSLFGKVLHTIIEAINIPYISFFEFAISVADFCTNMTGVARECLKLYGISTTANIICDDYRTYSTAKEQLSKFINLIYVRLEAEEQMQDAVEENTWLTEWFFKYITYKDEDTQENINYLKWILPVYLMKYSGI